MQISPNSTAHSPTTWGKHCIPLNCFANSDTTILPSSELVKPSFSPLGVSSTVFIWLNTAAFIKFLVIQVQRVFEGSVYTRAAFILNQVCFLQTIVWEIDHLNFKKQKHVLVFVWKFIIYIFLNFTNFHCGIYSRAAFINVSALNCGVYSRATFNRGRRLIQ